MKTARWFALVAPVILAATFTPATASATPPINLDSVVISQSTVDGIDYITRRITIQPGGSTGWHRHDGQVFAVVREGTLTRTMANCTEEVTNPDGGITEQPGDVHVGRNLGPVPVVAWVLQIAPAGTPWAIDVPSPGCNIP